MIMMRSGPFITKLAILLQRFAIIDHASIQELLITLYSDKKRFNLDQEET